MKVAAAYVRVSTSDQVEFSPESQVRLILEYAAKNGFVVPSEYIFRDDGKTGRNADKREQFQKMIARAKAREFEAILIYSTSRFARNLEDSIVYKAMLKRECAIDVISITQPPVDRKTDMLTGAIYAVMDEWYSMDLSDNVKRGMTQKALVGGTQSLAPFGYDLPYKGGGAPFVINESEAAVVRYIFGEYLIGTSKWYIAKKLNDMGVRTKKGARMSTRNITYILRNVVYMGFSRWTPGNRAPWRFDNPDAIISKAKHPPIIDEDTFYEVQKRMDEREAVSGHKERPAETKKHWLSGVIKCARCGSTLNYNGATPTRRYPSFRCGGYGKGVCKYMNFLTVSDAERLTLGYLRSVFDDVNLLYSADISGKRQILDERSLLSSEIDRLDKKIKRASDAFLNGVFTVGEFKTIKEELEGERNDVSAKLSEAADGTEQSRSVVYDKVASAFDMLTSDDFSAEQKNVAIRNIVEKIVYDKIDGVFRLILIG